MLKSGAVALAQVAAAEAMTGRLLAQLDAGSPLPARSVGARAGNSPSAEGQAGTSASPAAEAPPANRANNPGPDTALAADGDLSAEEEKQRKAGQVQQRERSRGRPRAKSSAAAALPTDQPNRTAPVRGRRSAAAALPNQAPLAPAVAGGRAGKRARISDKAAPVEAAEAAAEAAEVAAGPSGRGSARGKRVQRARTAADAAAETDAVPAPGTLRPRGAARRSRARAAAEAPPPAKRRLLGAGRVSAACLAAKPNTFPDPKPVAAAAAAATGPPAAAAVSKDKGGRRASKAPAKAAPKAPAPKNASVPKGARVPKQAPAAKQAPRKLASAEEPCDEADSAGGGLGGGDSWQAMPNQATPDHAQLAGGPRTGGASARPAGARRPFFALSGLHSAESAALGAVLQALGVGYIDGLQSHLCVPLHGPVIWICTAFLILVCSFRSLLC